MLKKRRNEIFPGTNCHRQELAYELDNKIKVFREPTQPRKTIFPTRITTYGTKQNQYYTGRIMAEVTVKDLFT